MYNDFEGKVVVDLGCGTVSGVYVCVRFGKSVPAAFVHCKLLNPTAAEPPRTPPNRTQGMLSAGAALLGSPAVIGVDIDADALDVAVKNVDQFEDLPVEFVRADVLSIAQPGATSASAGGGWRRLRADTVIMNPPFGTRRKGADVDFLRAAARLVGRDGGAVYSLHKSSTRAHLRKVALQELGCAEAEVLAELRYDLPATYKFHK